MGVRARSVILGFLAVVVVVLLGGITMVGWQVVLGPTARAVTDRQIERTPERLARGRYLVDGVASCFHCHSEHDFKDPEYPLITAKQGAGWQLPVPELGTIVAPNITPDMETGIGAWTDDEVLRAMQEGVSKNGRALFPIMPYLNLAKLTDEDAASIVAYLRSIPPVKNVVPATQLIFPLSLLVKTMPKPLAAHAPAAPRTTAEARGEYLVTVVAGCQDCHTPADEKGNILPNMAFGGGGIFHDPGNGMKPLFSLNITQDPSGIAHYDEAMFIQVLHTGRIPGRMLNHIMPFEHFRNMTDDDLRDMWAFLKSQPPTKHRITNTDPPKPCPVCNQEHGLGELNVKK
jgi:cytochrome c553